MTSSRLDTHTRGFLFWFSTLFLSITIIYGPTNTMPNLHNIFRALMVVYKVTNFKEVKKEKKLVFSSVSCFYFLDIIAKPLWTERLINLLCFGSLTIISPVGHLVTLSEDLNYLVLRNANTINTYTSPDIIGSGNGANSCKLSTISSDECVTMTPMRRQRPPKQLCCSEL